MMCKRWTVLDLATRVAVLYRSIDDTLEMGFEAWHDAVLPFMQRGVSAAVSLAC
jgi:hypothetical protein